MAADGPAPLIGVSTYRQVTQWWSWDRDAAVVPGAYLDLVVAAGGQPLLVPPAGEGAPDCAVGAEAVGRVLQALDGLVLIGGGDVDAGCYGDEPDPRSGGTNPRRDELELALVAGALEADLPLLAICRGLQVLNVHLGGDLVQWLPDQVGGSAHQPRLGAFGEVGVTTVAGSAVRRLLGGRVKVQCSHHQAIGTLGDGLVVTATSDDGVVEAVEVPDASFAVGVQWHPEESGDRRLFDGLVEAARARGVRSEREEMSR